MAGVYLIALRFRDAEAFSLPEDVFHFVEDGRAALGGTIFDTKSRSKLFEELALLARRFAGCNHADVVEEIALSSAAGVRQSFALDTKNRAALRTFGNFQALFAGQRRNHNLRPQRRLRHADGNRAEKVRAAPLEERMLLDLENDVQIARRTAIRSFLAFPGDAEPRARVHAGRNAQINSAFALEASLAAAIRAAFPNHLSGALALRTRARDGKEALLVDELPAPAALLAGADARAGFGAGSVARLAELQARDFDFSRDAAGGLFEGKRHVVAQIGAALRAVAAAPGASATEKIFESEEVPENILKILEDAAVESALEADSGNPRVAEAVIGLALRRVAQHAIRLGRFAEFFFGVRLALRVAVGMPLQRRLTIGGFNLFGRGITADTQNFVKIAFRRLCHGPFSSPVWMKKSRWKIRRRDERRRERSPDATLSRGTGIPAARPRGRCRPRGRWNPRARWLGAGAGQTAFPARRWARRPAASAYRETAAGSVRSLCDIPHTQVPYEPPARAPTRPGRAETARWHAR